MFAPLFQAVADQEIGFGWKSYNSSLHWVQIRQTKKENDGKKQQWPKKCNCPRFNGQILDTETVYTFSNARRRPAIHLYFYSCPTSINYIKLCSIWSFARGLCPCWWVGASSYNVWANKPNLSIKFLWLLDKSPHAHFVDLFLSIPLTELRAPAQTPCLLLILQELIYGCYGLLPNFNSGQCLVCSFACLW